MRLGVFGVFGLLLLPCGHADDLTSDHRAKNVSGAQALLIKNVATRNSADFADQASTVLVGPSLANTGSQGV